MLRREVTNGLTKSGLTRSTALEGSMLNIKPQIQPEFDERQRATVALQGVNLKIFNKAIFFLQKQQFIIEKNV